MKSENDEPIFYSADEIFQDIEGDPDNVNMTIPPELMERMGWKEGDNIKVTVEDGVITLTKV